MFKTLTLTTLLGAGMLGAETMQPVILPHGYTRICEDGYSCFRIELIVCDALLGGDANVHGKGEVHSTTAHGKTIPWEFGCSSYVMGWDKDICYDIEAPTTDILPGTAFTVSGHLELDVFDSITYSTPVRVDFRKLAKGGKSFSIDGHTLPLRVEDKFDILHYYLVHDGDETLIGVEVTQRGLEPDTCVFMRAKEEDEDDANESKEAKLDLKLPFTCRGGSVRVRAVYGKGRHSTQVPVHITVDSSCGVWAQFPEGFQTACTRSGVGVSRDDSGKIESCMAKAEYTLQAPEGLRFCKMSALEESEEGAAVELSVFVQTPADARAEDGLISSPRLADVVVSAEWKSGTKGQIDETHTFTLPLCKEEGEPLAVTLTPDGAPQEITFAGHTYTAALLPLGADHVSLQIDTPEKTDDVEICVNGHRALPQYHYTESDDDEDDGGEDAPVFLGYGLNLRKCDTPYTVTFTRLQDAGSITLPVHLTGKAGVPFKK